MTARLLPTCVSPVAALLAVLALTLLPQMAAAQLYSWKDAQGNVTIRNTPPPWYRESERSKGPRVQVLRNGKVADDTAWPLEKRQEGRTEAARQDEARAKAKGQETRGKKDEED